MLVPKDTDGDNVPDTWFEDADGDGFNDLLLVVAPRLYGPPPDEWPIARFTPAGINDAGQMIVNRFGGLDGLSVDARSPPTRTATATPGLPT